MGNTFQIKYNETKEKEKKIKNSIMIVESLDLLLSTCYILFITPQVCAASGLQAVHPSSGTGLPFPQAGEQELFRVLQRLLIRAV